MDGPGYKLLFFCGSQLERWEVFDAETPLQAIERAAGHVSDDKIELWHAGRRMALFRPPIGRAR